MLDSNDRANLNQAMKVANGEHGEEWARLCGLVSSTRIISIRRFQLSNRGCNLHRPAKPSPLAATLSTRRRDVGPVLNPRFWSYMASYDVASNICQGSADIARYDIN